jgi:uncharacterized protein (TIGR03067 family)
MSYRVLLAAVILVLVPAVMRSDEEDRKALKGTWTVVGYDMDGKELPPDLAKKMTVTIQGDRFTIAPRVIVERTSSIGEKPDVKFRLAEGKSDEAKYRLMDKKKQPVIELTRNAGKDGATTVKGVYLLDSDLLTICIPLRDGKLPRKIPDSPKAGFVRMVLKRSAARQQD